MGIGGAPEAVVAACALKCLGGEIHCRLYPRNEEEARIASEAGHDLKKILTINDLVSGDDVFFALTGVTSGDLVRGVRYTARGAETESLVMRSTSGTIRRIDSSHNFDKLMTYSSLPFESS